MNMMLTAETMTIIKDYVTHQAGREWLQQQEY